MIYFYALCIILVCMDAINTYLPGNIKLLRNTYNLTQQELGGILNVSRVIVQKYEQGQNPPIEVLLLLCRHFELDVNTFCTLNLKETGIKGAQLSNTASIKGMIEQQLTTFINSTQQEQVAMYRQLCFDHQTLLRISLPTGK